MKLLLLVTFVGLMQICSSASIRPATEKSSEESDEYVEKLRAVLEMIPGMDPNSVNEIISNFQMFGEISIETEELESGIYFLSLAINADFAKVYRAVFAFRLGFIEEYILSGAYAGEEDDDYSSAEEMEMELKQLESELAKELTPSQTDHAMRIIRGAGEYASFEESDENEFEFLLSMDHISKTALENNELLRRK